MICSDLHLAKVTVFLHDCAKLEAWLNRVTGPNGYKCYDAFGQEIYVMCLTPYEKECLDGYLDELCLEAEVDYERDCHGEEDR